MPTMPALIRIPSVLLLSLACGQALAAVPAKAPVRAAATEELALEPVMAGEFALQAGKLAEAARGYLQAAQQTDGDAGLAERATRISMLANDDASAAKGLALWQQRAPSSLTMRSAAGALAMRQGDVKAARAELQALLADPDERGWKFALAALIGGGRDPAVPAQVLGELVDANAIPPKIEAWQEFGRLALRMDKPELARRMIDEVVKRFPEEPRVALLRASQLQQAGETDKALSLLHDPRPAVRGRARAGVRPAGRADLGHARLAAGQAG
ncbi:hypothetical protein G6F31_015865 [Rhizopus arrhizus]|nr:hypothetical protein G6F31_015865 [Rhizopus arrhizus]